MIRNCRWIFPLVLLLLVASPRAFAHAVLRSSSPANGAVVHTRNVNLTLDYNSRIDAARSTVILTGPAGKTVEITNLAPSRPAELKASATNLADGAYEIHWQVLASDGHITRGMIAFTVLAR